MKTLLLAVSFFLLEIPVVHAQTPYFQGKDDSDRDRLPRRRRERSVAAAHRPTHDEIHSRQSEFYHPEHAGSQLDDRRQLCILPSPNRTHLRSAGSRPLSTSIRSSGAKKSNTIGASTVSSARRRRANTSFICAPIARTKPSKIFAKPASRPNAVPAAPPGPVSIFPSCWKKPSAPSLPSCSAIKAAAPSISRWKKARSTAAP